MIVKNIKKTIDTIVTESGRFTASYSEPCFYNYETRQWSSPIPYGDKIGGVYLIALCKEMVDWRVRIEDNDSDVLYIGKSNGDIGGRLRSHIKKLSDSFVAYTVKIEPFYFARTVESYLLALCIDNCSFSLSSAPIGKLRQDYGIPSTVLEKLRKHVSSTLKPSELEKYILKVTEQAGTQLTDAQLFGTLYLVISQSIEDRLVQFPKLNDYTESI